MPDLVSYTPPGEIAREFHLNDTFVRGILGPVGSGKSSSCCWEILNRALQMTADRRKRRRSRWAVIRNTYGELKNTTIKTWQDWFGAAGTIKWDPPITFHMAVKNIGDGTSLDLEVIFLALDTPETVGKLKSFEISGGWINEASETPKEILDMLTQRVGRYPAKKEFHDCMFIKADGTKFRFNAEDVDAPPPYWTGVIMDTNPPDDDHWWYEMAEESKPAGFRFFRQPGGLIKEGSGYKPNPMAENVQNISGGYEYYLRQLNGKNERWIKVYLCGEYGQTLDGKVVFPEWNDNIHFAKETIKPIMGRPIVLAFDYGLTPACIAGQMDGRGRVLILKEWLANDVGMGIRQFYSEVVRPDIVKDWKSFRIEGVGDPAGTQRAQTDEKSCMQELYEMGLVVEPAITNDFLPRRDAVAFFLTKLAGGLPGFLVDPSCKMIRKGFNGGYRYERLQIRGSEARYKDRPVKDKYSHPFDALQYLCLYIRNEMNPVRKKEVKQHAAAW